MRGLKRVTSAVLLLLAVISSASALGPYSDDGDNIAERMVQVDRFGFVYVYDTVPAPGGRVEVGFPKELLVNLVDYHSPDGVVELRPDEEVFWLTVKASSPVDRIRLTTIFGDLLHAGVETFRLNLSVNPVTRERIGKVGLKISLPQNSEIVKLYPAGNIVVGEGGVTAQGELVLDTTRANMMDIEFKVGEIRVVVPSSVQLQLDPSTGTAEYTVRLRMKSGRPLTGLDFTLPPGSEVIDTRDHLRVLSRNYDKSTGSLRVSLDDDLEAGEVQTVIVRFKPPENTFYKLSPDSIRVQPLLPFNLSTPDYRLTIVLPPIEYTSSSVEPIEVRRVYPDKTVVSFSLGIVSPLTGGSKPLEVNFKRLPTVFTYMPVMLGASLAVLALGIAVYYLASLRRPIEAELGEKIRRLQEEVDGLLRSSRIVGELISGGRILDKGYIKTRILEVRGEISKHVSRIVNLSAEVRRHDPRFGDQLDMLTSGSKMVERLVDQLWLAVQRYLSGGVGRKAFTDQVEDIYKSILRELDRLSGSSRSLKKTVT